MRYIYKILFVILLCGCARQELVQTGLYFGLSMPDGKIIADSTFEAFVKEKIIPVFDKGFTQYQARGYWIDSNTREPLFEPSRIIIAVHIMSKELSLRINSLRETYKNRFGQQSVLRTDQKIKARF